MRWLSHMEEPTTIILPIIAGGEVMLHRVPKPSRKLTIPSLPKLVIRWPDFASKAINRPSIVAMKILFDTLLSVDFPGAGHTDTPREVISERSLFKSTWAS